MAKRTPCLGPASGVINCTPLSTLSFWVSLFPRTRGYNTSRPYPMGQLHTGFLFTYSSLIIKIKAAHADTITTCVCTVAQSCLTLCDLMDCSPSGSPVHGIFQARILEWVVISFSRGSSWPRDQTMSPALANRFFTIAPPGKSQILLENLKIAPLQNNVNSLFTWETSQYLRNCRESHVCSLQKAFYSGCQGL